MGRMIMPSAGSQNIHTAPKITSQFVQSACPDFFLPISKSNTETIKTSTFIWSHPNFYNPLFGLLTNYYSIT